MDSAHGERLKYTITRERTARNVRVVFSGEDGHLPAVHLAVTDDDAIPKEVMFAVLGQAGEHIHLHECAPVQ